jgi:hypothetical protein
MEKKTLTYVGKCACNGLGKQRGKTTYYCKGGSDGDVDWRVINKNAWNRKHLIYRKYSHKTSTAGNPKADPNLALSTTNPVSEGAYISLLQVDTSDYDKALGANHQIIWCPKDCNVNDVPKGKESTQVGIPTIIKKTLILVDKDDKSNGGTGTGGSGSGTGTGTGTGTGGGGGGTMQQAVPDDGWPWWLWLLIAAAGTMGAGAVYKSRKKGQKGKK